MIKMDLLQSTFPKGLKNAKERKIETRKDKDASNRTNKVYKCKITKQNVYQETGSDEE